MEIIPYIVDLLIAFAAIFVFVLFVSYLKNKFKKEPEPALRTVKSINKKKITSAQTHRSRHSQSHTKTANRKSTHRNTRTSRTSRQDTSVSRSEKDDGFDLLREISNKKRKGRFEILNDPNRKGK